MSLAPLFGLLILDREPFDVVHFWGLVQAWLSDAGGFAFAGLLLYLVYAFRTSQDQAESVKYRAGVNGWMLAMTVLAIVCYATYLALLLTGKGVDRVNVPVRTVSPGSFVMYVPPSFSTDYQPVAFMLGGLFSLLGIGQPFAASLAKVKYRRIAALSKLGFKEAVRSRLFWVFLIPLIPLLFPVTWFFPGKAENQLRMTIDTTSLATTVILLISAALLASFSIPNDIKNQNIFTVLTKPVERFEIVLGRFFGYGFLLTLALAGMTLFGWLFIYTSTIDPKAAAETYMARQPVRGTLEFRSRRELQGERFAGTNVGREFDYRKYIAGDPASSQRAVWEFDAVPSGLGSGRAAVPCEFTFDIFRMTKGEENRGVAVTVRVVTWQTGQVPPRDRGDGVWRWEDPARQQAYQAAMAKAVEAAGFGGQNPAAVVENAKPGTKAWDVVNQLTREFGYYEYKGKEIFDYHPEQVAIPTGIFENARSGRPPEPADGRKPTPLVRVYVNCTTPGQMVGMADGDLYFLENEAEPSAAAFAQNYFKSAVGLWCRVMLVVGVAVVLSTYFAGVIGFLVTAAIFIGGYFAEHINDVAKGSYVGGPFKAMMQLTSATSPTAPVGETAVARAALAGDQFFSWLVRRVINLVPDVYAFDWGPFVAEGFNVPFTYLVMNVVVLAGYLIPWFVLAFYLMRSREVAA